VRELFAQFGLQHALSEEAVDDGKRQEGQPDLHRFSLPAALVSGSLLAVCWLLYLFVRRVDRENRGPASDETPLP
jgi:hypothetical protein